NKGVEIHNAELLVSYFKDLARSMGKDLSDLEEKYRLAGSDIELSHVLEMAKMAGIIAPEFEIEEVNRFLKVYRANRLALENYEPQSYSDRTLFLQALDQG